MQIFLDFLEEKTADVDHESDMLLEDGGGGRMMEHVAIALWVGFFLMS